MGTSSLPLVSRLTFQLSVTDYLFEQNVLTIGSKNGDELSAPGLQADFSALYVGIFIQAECTYYW
jgi:hypothetical protein